MRGAHRSCAQRRRRDRPRSREFTHVLRVSRAATLIELSYLRSSAVLSWSLNALPNHHCLSAYGAQLPPPNVNVGLRQARLIGGQRPPRGQPELRLE